MREHKQAQLKEEIMKNSINRARFGEICQIVVFVGQLVIVVGMIAAEILGG
jgi:hypothetical protein